MTIKLSKIDRIALLKDKQSKIKARIQNLQASDKSKERKMETRRKVLVGAYYLEKAKESKKMDELNSLMDSYLSRNFDRVLFGLKLREEDPEKQIKN